MALATDTNPVQINAPTGLTLYFPALNLSGMYYNPTTPRGNGGLETFNPANWITYALPLLEPIAGSGIYFGALPPGLPIIANFDTLLLPIYQQTGSTPNQTADGLLGASTNPPRRGLTLVCEIAEARIKSIAPLAHALGDRPVAMPQRDTSLSAAQKILNLLYDAQERLARTGGMLAAVSVDGQNVQVLSPVQIQSQIVFWERKVARMSGRRRRVNTLRLDRF